MILLNQTNGDIYLNSLVDFERTKNLTVLLSVNNTKDGVGELCGGFDKSKKNIAAEKCLVLYTSCHYCSLVYSLSLPSVSHCYT